MTDCPDYIVMDAISRLGKEFEFSGSGKLG